MIGAKKKPSGPKNLPPTKLFAYSAFFMLANRWIIAIFWDANHFPNFMEFLKELFGASTGLEAFYWLVATLSTGFIGLKGLTGMIGLELDYDFDLDINGDDVSLSSIMAFLCIGSWTGLLAFQMDFSNTGVIASSATAGTIGFFLSVVLFNKMKKLEQSGNIQLENAIGQTAEVYLSIPGEQKGTGQVQVIVQGRLATLEAMTMGGPIPTGQKVIVYQVENDHLLVEPLPAQELLE